MKKEILCAVDLSVPEPERQRNLLTLAKQFAEIWDCQIRPIFVLNNKILRDDVDIFMRLHQLSSENMEEILFKNFSDENNSSLVLDGKLLISKSMTQRGQVRSLLDFSEENNIQAIFCNTRTRSKYRPSFLGGFTEALLTQSKIPIVSVHPEVDVSQKIKHILFPSSLETEEEPNLTAVINLASKFQAKLTIFFNPESADQSIYLSPHFASADVYDLIVANDQKVRAKKEKIGQNYVTQATREGVSCELVISQSDLLVDESILEHAKANSVDLIAMTSKASKFEGALFGSMSKEVLRRSPCPVWVIHK